VHGVNGFLGDAFARGVDGADLVHGDEPLVGQHGFDHLAGAGADGHHELVLLGLDQRAAGFQVGHDGFAGHEAVHAPVFFRRVVVDGGLQRQHTNHVQTLALAHGVVVGVVRGRHLHHAGAKGFIHIGIGNDGDGAVAQRQHHLLANQVLVALVFGVNHHRHVAQHGFRAGGGHGQAFDLFAVDRLRAVGKRVLDVPERAVFFLVFHFQVGHRALQHRVPVDQALAPVDQALVVQLHKGVGDHLAQLVVHGEVFAAPVHAVAHAAHLGGDGVAALLLPFPHFGHEVFARFGGRGAHVVAADALGLQLALHHNLRGNARVVGAGHPHRVEPGHAVVAGQAVHDGLVEGMAHVQRARHIGRRQLDGEGR
jgi:hypothetical protein